MASQVRRAEGCGGHRVNEEAKPISTTLAPRAATHSDRGTAAPGRCCWPKSTDDEEWFAIQPLQADASYVPSVACPLRFAHMLSAS